MNILVLTTSYPARSDGESAAGTFVADFASALCECGARVTVVFPTDVEPVPSTHQAGPRLSPFKVRTLPLSTLRPHHPLDWRTILDSLAAGQAAVDRQCTIEHFDHILACWALPCGEWARRAGRRHGIPYSIWSLGSDIWQLGRLPIVRSFLIRALKGARQLFADGLSLCADVERLASRRCEFLPSSRRFLPETVACRPATPTKRFAFLGRWHPNKGIDLLLDALESLDDETWRGIEEFRVVGGGPLQDAVLTTYSRLRERSRCFTMGGYVDIEGARRLLTWTDYLVIPSRIESIPVVFSDAMQAGRPVIATPVGDLPSLLEKYRCGLLSPSVTSQGIAEAISIASRLDPDNFNEGITAAASQFDTLKSARSILDRVSRHDTLV